MKRCLVYTDMPSETTVIAFDCDEVEEREGFLLAWKGENIVAGFKVCDVVAWLLNEKPKDEQTDCPWK